jgi:hypothetical protein
MQLGPNLGRYTRSLGSWIAATLLLVSAAAAQSDTPVDSDQDGLSDTVEQALLEKFRPTFMISVTDCAVRPARFEPGLSNPKPIAADGTIYGQVFPVPGSSNIEIHYYTLWDKDCGRIRHPLDAEHVSVIVSNGQDSPKALYWYAGAHEKTACDISSGARAEAIKAQEHGPRVWSSAGKHALYLRRAMCGRGCGADSCENAVELPTRESIVNLGEPKSPANGSLWVASPQWMLADKMDSDFPPETIARLDATSGETVITLRGNSSIRGTIQGGDAVLDGAAMGAQHTGAALDTANDHTARSLAKATRATGRSLRKAWNSVFGRHAKKTNQ